MWWSAYMWILPVDFGWRRGCLNNVTVRIFISIMWLMIERSRRNFLKYIYFRECGGGKKTSASNHKAVCCKCMQICLYWGSFMYTIDKFSCVCVQECIGPAQWVWAAVVWPWVFPDRWSLLWDLLCSERLSLKPLLYCSPQLAVGLWEPKVPWGEAASAVFFPGQKMPEGPWVSEWWAWIGHYVGECYVPWAVGWALMSWVAGLSREQGFAQFQGSVGVPANNLLLLSSLGCFLVKM